MGLSFGLGHSKHLVPLPQLGQDHLHHSVHRLLANHNDGQLHGKFQQATAGGALFLSVAEEPVVLAWVPHQFALDEGYVENGGVEVDELQQVDLEGEGVVELGLGSLQLFFSEIFGHPGVYLKGGGCPESK